MTPAIEPNEILTAVRFPLWSAKHAPPSSIRTPPRDFRHRLRSRALEPMARQDHARLRDHRGIGAAPVRATEVEKAIVGHARSNCFARP